ncbi:MAG: class I SAM-dependent methyltransferase [Planctomycetes bacterium]|nr:class I SAM-dependent methyltransferase [Planctomycetota bacterium]
MGCGLESQERMYEASWEHSIAVGKEQHGNLEVNLAFLEAVDLLQPGMDVLEVGCGIGTVVEALRQKGCRAQGTDISAKAVAYGREKYPGIELAAEPAEQMSWADGSFDVVVSFDVVEHLVEVEMHLAEVRRVLREGGYYLVGTPNKYCSGFFDTLRKRGFSWKQSHPSLQSWRGLRRRMERCGFDCRFVKMNPVSEFTLAKLKRYRFLSWLVQRVNVAKLPLGWQSYFYLVGLKKA